MSYIIYFDYSSCNQWFIYSVSDYLYTSATYNQTVTIPSFTVDGNTYSSLKTITVTGDTTVYANATHRQAGMYDNNGGTSGLQQVNYYRVGYAQYSYQGIYLNN